MMTQQWLTASQAARRLGLSYFRVRELAQAGRLTFRRNAARQMEFALADVDRLVAERATDRAAAQTRRQRAARHGTPSIAPNDADQG
jgi:excisionase family DNA binding protein